MGVLRLTTCVLRKDTGFYFMDFLFFVNAVAFGVGLAMDAFSVSLANGLNEPDMSSGKTLSIAGTFGIFQFVMPMIGWVCVHYLVESFTAFQPFIPWIALILLLYIGGKMLYEAINSKGDETEKPVLGFGELFVQGVATSIDALSVGFTISELGVSEAIIESLIIGVVTTFICIAGTKIGKKFGTKYAKSSSIVGGVILIAIGIEIFVKGVIL